MLRDRERFILLNLIPGVGSLRLRRLLDHFGGLEQVWQAAPRELQQIEGIGPKVAADLHAGCRNERALEEELALARREGVAIVTLNDAEYPPPLRDIWDPPLALYYRGSLPEAIAPAVAVVGSRRASFYGLEAAERLGYDLALRGVTVVSGLARGIDAAAHRGALKARGRTAAVLGCGLRRVYPPEHEPLAKEVAQAGAVLSEYPMQAAPLAQHFPQRNRIISGLSLGVVIVEAAPRSGALITADCALEQGREVFAVPGPITQMTSQGTHQLLKQGARLVTGVDDILEELRLTPRLQPVEVPRQAERVEASGESADMPLGEPARRVLASVPDGDPLGIDAIAGAASLPVAEVAAALSELELKLLIRQAPGKRFVRTSAA